MPALQCWLLIFPGRDKRCLVFKAYPLTYDLYSLISDLAGLADEDDASPFSTGSAKT